MYEELKPLEGINVPRISEFWDWVKKTFTPSYRDEIHNYLSEATDIYDLERRMKYLEIRGIV